MSAEECEEGKNKVVILGYGLWQRRFGGDQNVIGDIPPNLDSIITSLLW